MSTFIAWAPLIIICGALIYGCWVYVSYLKHLENTRLHLVIDWKDGKTTRVEVQDYLEAQEIIGRVTWSWVKEAVVTKGSFVVAELDKDGVFKWTE